MSATLYVTAKNVSKFNQRQFANIATGDETWIHYFEPVTKIGNKIWLTKYDRRHVLAKGSVKHKEDSLLHFLLM